MYRLLFWLVFLPELAGCKGVRPMNEFISPSKAVDSILAKVRSSYSFGPAEVMAYQGNPKVYLALLERMRALPVPEKVACLDRFEDLGALVHAPEDGEKPFLAPYVTDPVIIQGLVEFLGDGEEEMRESAARQIFETVPDRHLRNHVPEVIAAIQAYPRTSRAAQILAKTGSQRAYSLIRSNGPVRDQDEMWTAQALAKLGDSLQEDRIMEAYRLEKDEGRKRDLAWVLGYVATPKAVLALARDLRNPMTYEWNQTGLRSFRVHVIEGLSRAFPLEPLLWKPNGIPRDDGYYDDIEKWAEVKLGVRWEIPRPPFLYQMDVPTPAGP